jgi:hypothetical protein
MPDSVPIAAKRSLSQRIMKKHGNVAVAIHPMDNSAQIVANASPMTVNGPVVIAVMFQMETSAPDAATKNSMMAMQRSDKNVLPAI